MILDSSALLAVLLNESEKDAMLDAIEVEHRLRAVSVANWLEANMVMFTRYGEAGLAEADLLALRLGLEKLAVTTEQSDIARRAFTRFGKGVHPAGLNFGDCFAYALAKDTGEKLLFKGEDFSQTDIPAVEY